MTIVKPHIRRAASALSALLLLTVVSGVNLSLFASGVASADTLASRSLKVSSTQPGNAGTTAAAGSYLNGQKTKHTFGFTVPSTSSGTVAAILLEYCTYATGPVQGQSCTSPTGFTAANVTTAVATGSGIFGASWTVDTTAGDYTSLEQCTGRTNCILITASATISGSEAGTIAFGGGGSNYITNPTSNGAYYARIQTYSSYTNATTHTALDFGGVATSVNTAINLTATVKETLGFSTIAPNDQNPATADLDAPGGSCTPLTTGTANITLGDTQGVLSISTQYKAHSYFRLFTNAANGVAVQYAGTSLTKGTRALATNTSATASAAGTEVFGLGIDSGDTKTDGYSFTQLQSTTDYGSANTGSYAFDTASTTTPVTIAQTDPTANSAGTAFVNCDTGSVQYVANISPNTPAGVYKTTLVYYAVPTY